MSFGYYVRAKFSICFWKGSICKVVKLEIGFKKKKRKKDTKHIGRVILDKMLFSLALMGQDLYREIKINHFSIYYRVIQKRYIRITNVSKYRYKTIVQHLATEWTDCQTFHAPKSDHDLITGQNSDPIVDKLVLRSINYLIKYQNNCSGELILVGITVTRPVQET